MTGFALPYDVIFTQKGLATLSVLPIQIQSDKSNGSTRHHLPMGSYMLSVAYDGPEMLELRKNVAEIIATIPAGEKGQTRTVFVPRVAVTDSEDTFYLVSTPARAQADSDAKGVLSVYPNELYDPDGVGVVPDPDPVDPGLTEVVAPAPSWTDNSDGGGKWTTPAVEGIKYNPASGTASPGQTVTVTATALYGYVLLGTTSWTHKFPVDPDSVDPGLTEVLAPAPVWTDNSDGGGTWTTPTVEGVKYSPANGTATPGQTVTVTATALAGYVLLGTTKWTHTFPEEPDPDPDDDPHSYSFSIREDTAPVNDRKQIYALTAEKWAALSYLRDQTASHAAPLGALNVALRSDAAEIIGVTSVTERALVENGSTRLDSVRTAWLRDPSSAYNSFVAGIGPVIAEISTKGVLI